MNADTIAGRPGNRSISNTRAAGSGNLNRRNIAEPNPDKKVLDELQEIEGFIQEKQNEGKQAFRLIYALGTANVTRMRTGEDSDLGLLLQFIQNEHLFDEANSMTYIYAFDSNYTDENIERDIEDINIAFADRRRNERNNNIIEPNRNRDPYNYFHLNENFPLRLNYEPSPTESYFPARYSFGENCYVFFLDSNLQSSCLNIIPTSYDRQQNIKRMGFAATGLRCQPSANTGFAYLQHLVQNFLVSNGELFIYNCAWEDRNEPYLNNTGQVRGVHRYTGNQYFDSFPELLSLVTHNYAPKHIGRYILYNHFTNLFKNESIVVRSSSDSGHLRLVSVKPETEFSRRMGGKRKTRKIRKVKQSRKH
jgi:hypothetical protein